MVFQKIRKGKNENYSLVNKLRKEKKINDEFEVIINSLTLEDIIGIKLELAARAAGGALYGLKIWSCIIPIVREAIMKFAYSATSSKKEAARFLGMTLVQFQKLADKYKTEKYFEKEEKKDEQK